MLKKKKSWSNVLWKVSNSQGKKKPKLLNPQSGSLPNVRPRVKPETSINVGSLE